MTQDKPASPPPASIKAEITAMRKAYKALRGLDYSAQDRALDWLNHRVRWGHYSEDEMPF